MRKIIFCVILSATVAVTTKGNLYQEFENRKYSCFWHKLCQKDLKDVNYLAKCDFNALLMPENADSWKCNKPVDQGKVERYTRCKLVCQDGYDLSKGKKVTHSKDLNEF